jgi:acetyltransferase-like isoleucine patch superfamily enzyme
MARRRNGYTVDVLLEKNEELTDEEKQLFGSFGVGAKIRPPFRILNPHRIFIGDYVSIREECYLHAYEDLTKLYSFIEDQYKGDFDLAQYRYNSRIVIGSEVQVGRNFFISCTNSVEIGRNVTISERVFIGDNDHSFSHPDVPIMQRLVDRGRCVTVGRDAPCEKQCCWHIVCRQRRIPGSRGDRPGACQASFREAESSHLMVARSPTN